MIWEIYTVWTFVVKINKEKSNENENEMFM